MRLFHRAVGLVVLAVMLSLGLAIFVAACSPPLWASMAEVFVPARLLGACLGLAIFCIALLFGLTHPRRNATERFLSFDNEGGTVSISTQAIADYISKLAPEFPSIVKMQPRIVPLRHAIDIVVDLKVRAGPQIHEVCGLVQQRVRESVTSGLGISDVKRVTVTVKDIVSEHKPG